jgi:hypothetical protein
MSESKKSEDTPLSCSIEDNQLVIRIGIDVLAMATEDREPFTIYDEKLGDHRKAWIVTDALEFAKDVRNEIQREEEDGSSPLTNLLDLACSNALDQGSIAVEEVALPEYEKDEDDE